MSRMRPGQSSMESLMKNLLSKNPHYVRCVKPNDSKAAGGFQDDLCRHQVRYLGYARPPLNRDVGPRAQILTPLLCLAIAPCCPVRISLLENVRVKRAGFCYRQKFDKFLERYKMVRVHALRARALGAIQP